MASYHEFTRAEIEQRLDDAANKLLGELDTVGIFERFKDKALQKGLRVK